MEKTRIEVLDPGLLRYWVISGMSPRSWEALMQSEEEQ